MILKFKKLHPDVPTPVYATDGAANMDIHSFEPPTVVGPSSVKFIRTGLAFEVPDGWVLALYSRSGHGKLRVSLANGTGQVDSDYRGEVQVLIENRGGNELVVYPGDRIAQFRLEPAPRIVLREVSQLSETDRGAGGFGSTGT